MQLKLNLILFCQKGGSNEKVSLDFASYAFFTAFAKIVEGVVVVGEHGCKINGYIVIYTTLGYVFAQQYSGSFDKDDEVVGDINSYGYKDVLVNSFSGRLWIDDYMLSKSIVSEKCFGDD